MKTSLKISCWNSDWATPNSKRGKYFIDKFDSDIICVTEGYESLLPRDGYIISSNEDYGYQITKGRRKVILWSKSKWTDIDQIGSEKIPTGRYISGITNGIKIIAGIVIVCVCVAVYILKRNKELFNNALDNSNYKNYKFCKDESRKYGQKKLDHRFSMANPKLLDDEDFSQLKKCSKCS